jgi:cytochrome c oxidase subunit 3
VSDAAVGVAGDRRPSMLAVGTTVWLASELMFFGGLFAAYFTIRAANPVWPPPPGVHLATVRDGFFTVLLVSSSGTMQRAVHQVEHGRRSSARWWVVLTIVLGVIFLANQGVEWATVSFSPSTNVYGSLFFIMTGLHGLHVLGGLLAMLGVLMRMSGPVVDPGEVPVIEVVTYYWHFVDVVWVGLYATLFLLR